MIQVISSNMQPTKTSRAFPHSPQTGQAVSGRVPPTLPAAQVTHHQPQTVPAAVDRALKSCLLTFDDGPHPNDTLIAAEAVRTGARVELFWNGENLFTEAGRKILRKIPADQSIGDYFGTPERLHSFIRENLDPEKQTIAKQIAAIAHRYPDNIHIGFHSTFHPHSKNKTIGGADNAAKPGDGRPQTVKYRYQLHPTSKEFSKLDQHGISGWEDDLRFFERTISHATGQNYGVSVVRLPGSNAKMAGEEYQQFLAKRSARYENFTHDSYDSHDQALKNGTAVKPTKAVQTVIDELTKNPTAKPRIYLWHSRTFQPGDITAIRAK